MLTRLIDAMHVRTSPATVQLDFCGVLDVLQLARTICMLGHHDWQSNGVFDSTVPPLEPFTLSLVRAVHSPWIGSRCVSGTFSLAFCCVDYLRHVGVLAGVWADFHLLSSPSSTPQTLITDFPSRMTISSAAATFIGNLSISLVPSAIPTISAASRSRLLQLLLCLVCHTWHAR